MSHAIFVLIIYSFIKIVSTATKVSLKCCNLLSILLAGNFLVLETLLYCWYWKYANIGILFYLLSLLDSTIPILVYFFLLPILAYYFSFTNVGILFFFYQCWICLCQYWHIFPFTNIGILHTNIGILFSFYQCWYPLYQYWHIIFLLPILVSFIPILAYYFSFTNVGIYNTLPILVCHLLIPKINQIYTNEKHTISPHWNLKYFPVIVWEIFPHRCPIFIVWI